MNHIPVMLNEVIDNLDPKEGDVFVDGTYGFGGHSAEIAKHLGTRGKIIGVEKDEEIFSFNEPKLRENSNLIFVNDDFRNIDLILEKLGIYRVDKILLDLGVSSYHFDQSERGFSFSKDEKLDMRLSKDSLVTARDLINGLSEKELADLFFRLSDERRSRQIAKAIVQARRQKKITTTSQLSDIIASANKSFGGKINPSTRVFQALRIAVNDEFGAIEEALPKAIDLLNTGGKLAVISFHSGEDRIVKNIFKKYAGKLQIKLLNKKPIVPTLEEIRSNPRSRSAKLRVAEKI